MNVQPLLSAYRVGSDRLLLAIGALATWSYVVDGPVRFLLHSLSAEMVLYSRDGLALLAVALAVLSWAVGQASALPVLLALAVLLIHCTIGVLSLPTLFQALMGLKIFLSFLLGVVLAPVLRRRPESLLRLCKVAFAVTGLGVFINLYIDYPWIGLSYETALGSVEASKQWWQSGALRLPGFARVSFNAATYMVLALVPLLAGTRSFIASVLLVGTAAVTILLTTTKGAWSGVIALLVESALAHHLGLLPLANGFLVVLATFCLALPVVAVQARARAQEAPEWLMSFMERVGDMWPRAFALWGDLSQVLWGRGLGGIGVAQLFGEAPRANAADNLMVYLLVTFGLFGLAYVALYLWRLLALSASASSGDFLLRCARGWTAVWLAYGSTTNMIEEPVMNMAIGVSFGLAFEMGYPRCWAPSEAPPS